MDTDCRGCPDARAADDAIGSAGHGPAGGFEEELARRCRDRGMSDEEIRKWMDET